MSSSSLALAATGLATSLYFGLSSPIGASLAIPSAFCLVKRAWDWKNAPQEILPENGPSLNFTAGVNKLYQDLIRCGLKGVNRGIAERRFKGLVLLAENNSSSPGLQRLLHIAQFIQRNDTKPTLATLSDDIDALFDEVVEKGLEKPQAFQRRWNELFGFALTFDGAQKQTFQDEIAKIISLQAILASHELNAETAPHLVPIRLARIVHQVEKNGFQTKH